MLTSIYRNSPYPLRVLAASARGYILRGQRYGRDCDDQVAQVLERDRWTAEQWQSWTAERLAFILERAVTRVPYYREMWINRRLHGEVTDWTLLENWPVLSKERLRADPQAFLADDVDASSLIEEHTSGSSGKPLRLWRSRETQRTWYGLFEARVRQWNNVSRSDRWGILGGQLITPVEQRRPPFWVWNAGLNQLYLSTYHISAENIAAYAQALRRHKIVYLLGYPSSLALLAHMALDQDQVLPAMKVILTNAEMLLPGQRKTIEKAFGCRVIDTYGMSELSAAASECEHGAMHVWPDAGLVEVFAENGDRPLPAGQTGRLICTGLINADMPLIRYEVGDRGALADGTTDCACGRGLPVLDHIDGRLDDVLIATDGRRIGRMDSVFKADLDVREAQIIQERLGTILVRLVPGSLYGQQTANAIIQRIRERLGPVEVKLETLDEIPRGANGKFKSVVNRMDTHS